MGRPSNSRFRVATDGAVSGGEQKASGDGVSADRNSPGSPSPPAVPSTSGRRRSLQKRVVTVPLADLNVPRPKGVGEGNTPTDSWAWRKYGQKPIKGSPFPSSSKGCPARKQVERSQADPDTASCWELQRDGEGGPSGRDHLHHLRRDVAVISPVALGGLTSIRPRSGREGRRVLIVGLATFITTIVTTPAVRPRVRHTRCLASVGRIHPRVARV
ncbi:hypothetical protein VPH35_045362 [Triticum aestivum]